ncbi:MAG: GNAT family N-acetyltransferase [candidate division SR1 bacterium]|nr:GNAT family N-acetyltransferase [candidate division SR1 bacterium]
MEISFTQDVDKTIAVFQNAGKWLLESNKNPSKWWQLQNLNKQYLFQYAKPEEFYVGLVEGMPAVAAILQKEQKAQDWDGVDKKKPPLALYIHWLAVNRKFAGKGLTYEMVNFAESLAEKEDIPCLRIDTDASESKLRKIYENLGFELVTVKEEDYRDSALYQKNI